MSDKKRNIGSEIRRICHSSQFRNTLVFLVFVVIASVFWFIIALDDNVTRTFKVQFRVVNVPDSVKFIIDPPAEIHVTLRDKGSNVFRTGIIKTPAVNIDFKEYARDGVMRLSHSDLMNEIKADFGGSTQISSVSIDSLRCYYATGPGKKVPVIVNSDVTAALGYIISGIPEPLQKSVLVYSYADEIDTIHQVYTHKLVRKNLSQSGTFRVKLVNIPNVRIVPSEVDVKVTVEPLVHKEAYVNVDALNVPDGESLILFPSRVPVSFFVPMSRFNDEKTQVHVVVDYNDIRSSGSSMLPLRITSSANNLINVELKADSVEYTLVRQ